MPVSGVNPDALTFSNGEIMYQYTIVAKDKNNREFEIKTVFDSDTEDPQAEVEKIIERYRSSYDYTDYRFYKSIVPML